jgi:hypothetical protein
MNIYTGDSNDKLNRSLFNAHPFELRDYTHPLIKDQLCCSNYSFISAHYMKPANMLLLDQVIKAMNAEYKTGLVSNPPSYEEIAQRYELNLKFLNLSQKNQL